ncbi:putative LRR receptor-like serine/threonine-protein kinase RKF3 [Dendrobium catenatum]|uniref:Putative LRR receptor-like serine/threonine-protein kinase RKF3 n=1 Tax=Dendrobium catenatum TaxID=906689 RepID=A0A2I0VJ82_9ASPA|nr:putative LRR receptor-like serine/threonine-protein kinase RKF3 [Dendrobium catenatum]
MESHWGLSHLTSILNITGGSLKLQYSAAFSSLRYLSTTKLRSSLSLSLCCKQQVRHLLPRIISEMKPTNHVYPILVFLPLIIFLPPFVLSQNSTPTRCPLDFSIAKPYVSAAASSPPSDLCGFSLQILHLVESHYLLTSNLFVPPSSSASSCWSDLSSLLSPFSISLPSSCNLSVPSISLPCMNLTSRAAFTALLPSHALTDLNSSCDRPLSSSSSCTSCTTTINRVKASYLVGPDVSNATDCSDYPFIYAAAAANRFGPSDSSTAYCLFLLQISSPSSSSGGGSALPAGIAAAAAALIAIVAFVAWYFIRRRRRRRRKRWSQTPARSDPLIGSSTTLIKFSFEEIRTATRNFSRENMIGRGGYGNVYKGVLKDGSEVAVKRFKNCSAAGDASFVHELEVISSVRHVNLVGLRGYCTATTSMEGHQRIIVCDLIANGSLHDHLFGSGVKKLSWPARQKIAVGTARGLAYLHCGMSHVSTRVAGTLGYVAPEYALFGQLTEKSDVFSYGVVMLELLSGKKAFRTSEDGQNWLVTDWAWSLVREGRALDVIEEGMEELGPNEALERYVLVAVLCSHPQLHARPTMDQVLKILDSDLTVPPIPDRPISIIANKEEIEKSMSSSSSGQLFSPPGYNQYIQNMDGTPHQGSEVL